MGRTNTHGLPTGITPEQGREDKYVARITFHGRRYQIGSYWTLADAKAALAIARSQVALDTFVPIPTRREQWRQERAAKKAESLTVQTWSTEWLARLQKAGRSPGTIVAYTSTMRVHVLPLIGNTLLKDVTEKHIAVLVAGKTDATAYNITRTVSSMFKAAIKAHVGGVTESPVTSTGQFGKPKRSDESDAATLAEVRAMAAGMPERLRVAVWLAATCALRLGEVLGLQRRDLDLEDQEQAVLHVRRQWLMKTPGHPEYADPKAGSAGTVAIPAAIVPMLIEHLDRFVGKAPESPLLPSPAMKTRPVSQSTFDRHWRIAREPVRPGFRFHALRHVGLTAYAQAGATNEELLRRGRHSSLDVAMRYQSATAARDRTLTDKLDAELRQALDH